MERLYIEQTKATPLIDFNYASNILLIKGQSFPENAFKFYEEIFKWVDEYLISIKEEVLIEIKFNLPYINTSSSKCIMMLLDKFDNAFNNGKSIRVNWYYDMENDSELECAEEFKEDVNMPFELIPITEEEIETI